MCAHRRSSSGHPGWPGVSRWDSRAIDEEKGYYALDVNQEFVDQVRERFDPGETLLLMCRSGGRSAMAVNLLAQAGYTDAWNITDAMEGDLVKDPEGPDWKNSNLPWTYQVDPERVRLPGGSRVSNTRGA